MAKNHKRLAAAGELQLPPEIIHHIQSFLDGKEAARTAIFNKSWYHAWSTRPNLFLDRHGCREFTEHVTKTMKRYEDLNLTIHTLRLRMFCEANSGGDSLANELLGKAVKFGATELDLDLAIRGYSLPHELLRSDALVKLSVVHFAIDLQKLNLNRDSNLKSLYIDHMTVDGGDLFKDWISRCPCLEELTLSSLTKRRLPREEEEEDGLDFHKLRYLALMFLDTKKTLSRARFHCLKELVIMEGHNSWNNIRISSPSLEILRIYLSEARVWNAVFDVPNIRRFVFEGCPKSRLRFKSTIRSRKWESEFRTSCSRSQHNVVDLWFGRLSRLVKMLATISKVSLFIVVDTYLEGYKYVGDGLPLPLVENLTLEGLGQKYPAFLNNLFLVCRPKLLTIWENCWGHQQIDEYLVEIVRRRLVEELKERSDLDWFGH